VLLNASREKFFINFYTRRALRIFPAYYLLLAGFFVIVFFFDNSNHFTFYQQNFLYFFFYFQNWLFVFKGIAKEAHLNHLWSLAMEEQFYLLWPLAIYFIKDLKKLKRLLWFTILFAFVVRICVWYLYGDRFETYHCNTIARIDSIAFGCLLGCGFSYSNMQSHLKRILIFSSFGILIGGIWINRSAYFTNPIFCTLGYSAASFLSACFLEVFITKKHKYMCLRNSLLFNFLGKISYSMYLIHMPLFLFLSSIFKFHNTVIGLISLGLTTTLAVFSFYLIELKFLHLKKIFVNKASLQTTN
jgi:peptidoglycan/LPS O-acetylase OafA/YrhL